MSHRLRELVSILTPIPFLLGMGMTISTFRQSDVGFVVGKVKVFGAVLVDQGQASETRGKPPYFPTLSDGAMAAIISLPREPFLYFSRFVFCHS